MDHHSSSQEESTAQTDPEAAAGTGLSWNNTLTTTTTADPSLTNSSEGVSSSSYSSWTVPSLDFFSARRASAFGVRYGLISSHSTLIPGRTSPAPSGTSLMLDSHSGVLLQNKARKSEQPRRWVQCSHKTPLFPCRLIMSPLPSPHRLAVSIHLSESITGVLNDSSLVFYRMNEHIHKKVPQLVEEKVRYLFFFCSLFDCKGPKNYLVSNLLDPMDGLMHVIESSCVDTQECRDSEPGPGGCATYHFWDAADHGAGNYRTACETCIGCRCCSHLISAIFSMDNPVQTPCLLWRVMSMTQCRNAECMKGFVGSYDHVTSLDRMACTSKHIKFKAHHHPLFKLVLHPPPHLCQRSALPSIITRGLSIRL